MVRGEFRIALYSHDCMGIGHFRRNLLIARALNQAIEGASAMVIAGACEANAFHVPPGVDCLTLPSVRKDTVADGSTGRYVPRRLVMPTDELVRLRGAVIRAALDAYQPDLLIVDKVPLGVARELEPALQSLRAAARNRDLGTRGKVVLGLRDILDDPRVVRREWHDDQSEQAVDRYYDAVWVYGDRNLYDPVSEYGFGEAVASKVRFTGYLERDFGHETLEASDAACAADLPAGRIALCQVGGGEDGGELAEAFAQAEMPPEMIGVIVTGPFMPIDVRRRVHETAARRGGRIRVIDFSAAPQRLLRAAERVITMGGYNSVSEVLCAGKRALVVPRVRPRREQWIRAQRLRRLGLIDVLDPRRLSAEALAKWLAKPLRDPSRTAREVLDFGGLARIPEFAFELCWPTQVFAAPLRSKGTEGLSVPAALAASAAAAESGQRRNADVAV